MAAAATAAGVLASILLPPEFLTSRYLKEFLRGNEKRQVVF
jgi:hypothetical protein